MRAYSVKYQFSQPFKAPAKYVYNWATDYQPHDLALMNVKGRRRITKITPDTILLKETTYMNDKPITKTKLVRLNRRGLSWSNTHLSGRFHYSQFIYQIVPLGRKTSRLDFTGLFLYYSNTKPSANRVREVAKAERHHDSGVWRHLARKINMEFGRT